MRLTAGGESLYIAQTSMLTLPVLLRIYPYFRILLQLLEISFAKISQIIGFIKFGKNLLHTVETREFLVLNSCLPGKRLLRQATARTAQTAR